MDYLGKRLGGTASFAYSPGEITAILNGKVKPPNRSPNFDMTSENTAKRIVELFNDRREGKTYVQGKGNFASITLIIVIYFFSRLLSFVTVNGFLKPLVLSDLIRNKFIR